MLKYEKNAIRLLGGIGHEFSNFKLKSAIDFELKDKTT